MKRVKYQYERSQKEETRLKQRATLKQEKDDREKTDAKKMMLMSDDGEENGDDHDLEG